MSGLLQQFQLNLLLSIYGCRWRMKYTYVAGKGTEAYVVDIDQPGFGKQDQQR